jgi:hypothetical protein
MYVLVQDKQKSILKMTIKQLSDIVLDSTASAWTELPEYVFEAVVEHVQGDREASASFRRVCHAWREAHDRLLTVLKPNSAPPDVHVWKKFGGVKTLHLNAYFVNDDAVRTLAPLSFLSSLSLGDYVFEDDSEIVPLVTDEGMRALSPLTTLTCLDLGGCQWVTDEGVRALAPLTSLINLNLGCCVKTVEGVRVLARLTSLTNLNLEGCNMTDEGVRALSPLTALISLNLSFSSPRMTDEGVRALSPLTALTSLEGRTDAASRVHHRQGGPVGRGGPPFYVGVLDILFLLEAAPLSDVSAAAGMCDLLRAQGDYRRMLLRTGLRLLCV